MQRTGRVVTGCVFVCVNVSTVMADSPLLVNERLNLHESQLQTIDLPATTPEQFEVRVNIDAEPVVLRLSRHSVRSQSYQVLEQIEGGNFVERPPSPVRTYRGILADHPTARVAASLLDDGLHATVWMDDDMVLIQPAPNDSVDGSGSTHVLYYGRDLVDLEAVCGTRAQPELIVASGGGTPRGAGPSLVQIACDSDYPYFELIGSSSGVEDDINYIINEVSAQYENDVDMYFAITSIIVRSVAGDDPYTTDQAVPLLVEFKNEWNTAHDDIVRDTAHLFTGRDLWDYDDDGEVIEGIIGVAYVGTICSATYAYGLSQSLFDAAEARRVELTAHEIGHNFNAWHCNDLEHDNYCADCCTAPSYTMCSSLGVSLRGEFCSATVGIIESFRDSLSCLGDFLLLASPSAIILDPDDFANVTISATPLGGFSGSLDLALSDTLPACASASLGDYSIPVPGETTLTITTTGCDDALGLYSATVTATASGGSPSHNVPVSVQIGSDLGPVINITDIVLPPGPPTGTGTVEYEACDPAGTDLWTTDWQYSFDNSAWEDITGAAIGNNNPKPPCIPSSITWDTLVDLPCDETETLWYRMKATNGTNVGDLVLGPCGLPDPLVTNASGMAWGLSSFWVSDESDKKIYKFTIAGCSASNTDTYSAPDDKVPSGLAFDEASYLYLCNAYPDGKIWKLDANNPGQVITSRTFDYRLYGLGWDGTYVWSLDRDGNVRKHDPGSLSEVGGAVNVGSGDFPCGEASGGLACDSLGRYLYVTLDGSTICQYELPDVTLVTCWGVGGSCAGGLGHDGAFVWSVDNSGYGDHESAVRQFNLVPGTSDYDTEGPFAVNNNPAPSPNPMIFASVPVADTLGCISMEASVATLEGCAGIEYFFEETTGNAGGSDSGWQASTSYTNCGLSPNTQYAYRVRARATCCSNPAETGNSPTIELYSPASPPGLLPFGQITSTTIEVQWDSGGNPAGTEYFAEETTGTGSNSAWTTQTSWVAAGLNPQTQYCFQVKARNGDAIETDWVGLGCATTGQQGCESDAECDDGDLCTDDVCNVDMGECENTPIECPEGQECNPDTGACEPSVCEVDADCDDGDLCTVDLCVDSVCANEPVVCAPGETCDPDTGECVPAPICEANENAKIAAFDAELDDHYGQTVAICGDFAAVGSRDGNGSVYVYRLEPETGMWCQEGPKLFASDPVGGDQFGASVACDGDRIVVGASGGLSAHVFRYDPVTVEWNQEGEPLTASDTTTGDAFGNSVSISGDRVVVGAFFHEHSGAPVDSGAAYVFQYNPAEDVWQEQCELLDSAPVGQAQFGISVAVVGDLVAVGADQDGDESLTHSGSVSLFELDGAKCNPLGELPLSEPASENHFGVSVSINVDGLLVVGAPQRDGGAPGLAYVFEDAGGDGKWTKLSTLSASDGVNNDFFGNYVSISGDVIVVGAPHAVGGNRIGAAYAFWKPPGGWTNMTETAKLVASDAAIGDTFGISVSVNGSMAIIGAPDKRDDLGVPVGFAYVFHGLSDCDVSGVLDICDIADGVTPDCNGNGIPDECDIAIGTSEDCNENGTPDECDIDDLAFGARAEYPVGSGPESVVVCDFDGDGDFDVAVANTFSDNVSIFLNDGNGQFELTGEVAVGEWPHAVTCGDFDADGDSDLAVANYEDDTLSILLNDGSATFATWDVVTVGDQPASVHAADLDGDQNIDLVAANQTPGDVSVLLNLGKDESGLWEGFGPPATYPAGSTAVAVTSTVLDDDGIPDLAVANDILVGTVSLLRHDGFGGFLLPEPLVVGAYPLWVIAGDLDGDGHVDLVAANTSFGEEEGTVSVLFNDGNGGFLLPAVDYSVGVAPRSVAIADLDGDGHRDLAVANDGSGTISVLLNDGNGIFVSSDEHEAGSHPRSIMAHDLNNDDSVDLVLVNHSSAGEQGSLSVLLSESESQDCNGNGIPDECDIETGTSFDEDGNGVPDECEADCNENGIFDECDLDCGEAGGPCDLPGCGLSQDCNLNGIPDECDPDDDCNQNGVQDICDIAGGTSEDCNLNGVPDECDVVNKFDFAAESGELSPLDGESPQSYEFTDLPEAIGDVLLSFTATGDLDGGTEYVTVDFNDIEIDIIFEFDGQECADPSQVTQIAMTAAEFESMVPDRIAVIDMIPSEDVSDICDTSFISVAIEYWASVPNDDCQPNGVPDECEIDQANGPQFFCDPTSPPPPLTECASDCNANGVPDECEELGLVSAASCATHGAAGDLCIDLPLEGESGIDPRLCAGAELVMTFECPLEPPLVENITVTRCTGGVIPPRDMEAVLDESGTILTLTFPGLPGGALADEDCYTVDVSAFELTGDVDFEFCLLEGDVNENGAVDPLDSGAVLARFGCDVVGSDPACFTADVNCDGAVDPLDSGAVLARFGATLPVCD